jgi:hypothetical protein
MLLVWILIFEGDQAFVQMNGEHFHRIILNFDYFQIGSILITLVSLAILILWNKISFLKLKSGTRSFSCRNCRCFL